jgi:TorA maturation chaperone TorD
MITVDKIKAYTDTAEARRLVYDLLSVLYLELPDVKMVEAVFDHDCETQLSAIGSLFNKGEMQEGLQLIGNFISCSRQRSKAEILQEVSVDRTRLFRGIDEKYSPPPPYESVYREDKLCGKPAGEVSALYTTVGMRLSEDYIELPDYLGVELDFMRIICQTEKECWSEQDCKGALKGLETGSGFLKEHLLQWVPLFCVRMYEKAKLDFYRGLARLTNGFLEYDNILVQEQIREVGRDIAIYYRF